MSTSFNNQDEIIDSRDIIARIEELEGELDAVKEDNAGMPLIEETWEWIDVNVKQWHESDEGIELKELQALAAECEGYSDWSHGTELIREDYFVEHITRIIDDCYELPRGDGWPYTHLTMDYEAAAKDAEQDYALVSFGNQDYFIRNY